MRASAARAPVPAEEDDLLADSTLQDGAPAPDFSLPASTGETIGWPTAGQASVVLYFYPKDDTPGCTIEACSFRDNLASVQGHGAVLLGVAPTASASHRPVRRQAQPGVPVAGGQDNA